MVRTAGAISGAAATVMLTRVPQEGLLISRYPPQPARPASTTTATRPATTPRDGRGLRWRRVTAPSLRNPTGRLPCTFGPKLLASSVRVQPAVTDPIRCVSVHRHTSDNCQYGVLYFADRSIRGEHQPIHRNDQPDPEEGGRRQPDIEIGRELARVHARLEYPGDHLDGLLAEQAEGLLPLPVRPPHLGEQ